MIRASELQETEANLHLAQIYDNGVAESLFVISYPMCLFDRLFSRRKQDWKQAAHYYEHYISIREVESNAIDEDSGTSEPSPVQAMTIGIPFHDQHDIVARLAMLCTTGGFNLLPDYRRAGKQWSPRLATSR